MLQRRLQRLRHATYFVSNSYFAFSVRDAGSNNLGGSPAARIDHLATPPRPLMDIGNLVHSNLIF